MSELEQNPEPTIAPAASSPPQITDEVSPDDLLSDFRGKSVASIVIFTVVIHAIVLFGTSAPYLMKTFLKGESSKLTEEQKIENAKRDATASLRKIAKKHGINPQDLSDQLGGGTKATTKSSAPQKGKPKSTETPAAPKTSEPEKPKSAIEKELDKKAKGPVLPKVPNDTEEDLFK